MGHDAPRLAAESRLAVHIRHGARHALVEPSPQRERVWWVGEVGNTDLIEPQIARA
jgi:hypothetical protein